tara:strand:+ start:103 stop:237 length:135 start_codon:yes stop_codon:yes gene_type:complete
MGTTGIYSLSLIFVIIDGFLPSLVEKEKKYNLLFNVIANPNSSL